MTFVNIFWKFHSRRMQWYAWNYCRIIRFGVIAINFFLNKQLQNLSNIENCNTPAIYLNNSSRCHLEIISRRKLTAASWRLYWIELLLIAFASPLAVKREIHATTQWGERWKNYIWRALLKLTWLTFVYCQRSNKHVWLLHLNGRKSLLWRDVNKARRKRDECPATLDRVGVRIWGVVLLLGGISYNPGNGVAKQAGDITNAQFLSAENAFPRPPWPPLPKSNWLPLPSYWFSLYCTQALYLSRI